MIQKAMQGDEEEEGEEEGSDDDADDDEEEDEEEEEDIRPLLFGRDVNAAHYVDGHKQIPETEVADEQSITKLFAEGYTMQVWFHHIGIPSQNK